MKKNPFLKLEEKIIRLTYGNTATLTYCDCTQSYNSETGEVTKSSTSYVKTIYIGKPSEFADALVDKENIRVGDIKVEVSRKSLIEAMPGSRTDSMMRCGLNPDTDTLNIGGRNYRICKIQPQKIYGNEPAVYKLHLREI